VRQDEPIARQRDTARSGHEATQAPHPGHAEGSNSSASAPSATLSDAERALVGQASTQQPHAEQRPVSTTISPSGARGDSNLQSPVCPVTVCPVSADIAWTVASGS
jgi:hypothetical protein